MQANLLQRDRLTVRELGYLTSIDPSSLGKSFRSASESKRRELARYLIGLQYNPLDVSRWGKTGVPIAGAIDVLKYYTQASNPQKRSRAKEGLQKLLSEVGECGDIAPQPQQVAIGKIESEFAVNAKGQATVSLRGAARICGVTEQALSVHFGDNLKPSKLTKTLFTQGFDADKVKRFAVDGILDTALAVIIQHYAVHAGRYCTEPAKLALSAFAAVGIRTWIQSELGWQKPEPKPKPVKHLPPTPDEIASVFDITLGKTSLPAELVAGVKLNAIAASHPHLRETCEEGRRLLAAHASIPEPLLTPTAIGERLRMSAQAVNRLLVDLGYQTKNRFARDRGHRSEAAYVPTEKGRKYCSLTLGTARNDTTYQHLKWNQSIVEELQRSLQGLWWYVLDGVPHRATRELLRQQGRLLGVGSRVARIGVSSGLVRVTTSKLETIESAFTAALGRSVDVKIEEIG